MMIPPFLTQFAKTAFKLQIVSLTIPKGLNCSLNGTLLSRRTKMIRCMIASSCNKSESSIHERESRNSQATFENGFYKSFANGWKHVLENITMNLSNSTFDILQSGCFVNCNVSAFYTSVAISKVRLTIFMVNDDASIVMSWSQKQWWIQDVLRTFSLLRAEAFKRKGIKNPSESKKVSKRLFWMVFLAVYGRNLFISNSWQEQWR